MHFALGSTVETETIIDRELHSVGLQSPRSVCQRRQTTHTKWFVLTLTPPSVSAGRPTPQKAAGLKLCRAAARSPSSRGDGFGSGGTGDGCGGGSLPWSGGAASDSLAAGSCRRRPVYK